MKIPFGKPFQLTPAQLKDGVAEGIIDGYLDHDNSLKSRLGLTEWDISITSTATDGLYVNKDGLLITVAGGVVYVTTTAGTTSTCTGPALNVGTLCTFAEDNKYVFIGHGGNIAQVDPVALTVTFLTSASAPVGATHVICLQGYLLSNGTGGAAGDTFFTGPYTVADYLTTFEIYNNESLPDGCSAMMTDGQFAYAFGQRSVEISVNDGVTPFARYGMAFIPYGISAPYSVAVLDGTFYWLGMADNALRVMKMAGGAAQTISTPYDTVINSLTTTSDAYAFSLGHEGHTFYVLQFPTEEFTLVYHLQKDAWYQWSFWDAVNGDRKAFLGRCHVYHPTLNKNIIGTTTSATTAHMTGFTDNGQTIRAEFTSGNISGGTYKNKRASKMRFQLQRGETNNATRVPDMQWQHRDDGGEWKPERIVSLGALGQYGFLGQLDRCGIYRERQHKILFSDYTCQLVLVDVEETTNLLDD